MRGVPLGNEVAVDARNGDVFVTNRDAGGYGALTKIARDGTIVRVRTGDTAEGLALDLRHGVAYVGNVNDNSVAEVDMRTMRVLRKYASVPRTFGIALDDKAQRLFVVSNMSPSMPGNGGNVAAIDLRSGRIVTRTKRLPFPIGVAYDAARKRVFVTDEGSDRIYVFDARTLRSVRAPLETCRTPWRPRIAGGRLYVPCARGNQVDVFNLRTLHRLAHAPFATGGFPLSVSIWP
jgi:DNA-binding beta-propeller fold protein YncE